ncbi:uncharacterized protein AAEQ78_018344 [Lycaon pictus]
MCEALLAGGPVAWGRGPAASRIPYSASGDQSLSASSLLALPGLVSRPPDVLPGRDGNPHSAESIVVAGPSRPAPLVLPGDHSVPRVGGQRAPLPATGRTRAILPAGPHWPPRITSTFRANEVTVSQSQHFRGGPCHRQHPQLLRPLSDCHLVLLSLPASPPSAVSPEPAGPSPGAWPTRRVAPSSPRRSAARAQGPSVTCTALSWSSGPAAASVGPTRAWPWPLH